MSNSSVAPYACSLLTRSFTLCAFVDNLMHLAIMECKIVVKLLLLFVDFDKVSDAVSS